MRAGQNGYTNLEKFTVNPPPEGNPNAFSKDDVSALTIVQRRRLLACDSRRIAALKI